MGHKKTVSCQICPKPVVAEYRPFCSQACANQDLGRWLDGKYRIPTEERPQVIEGSGEDDDDAR